MRATMRELIEEVIEDPNINEEHKVKEREKLIICKECPDYNKCSDCGSEPWKWWEFMVENKAKPNKTDNGLRDCIQNFSTRDEDYYE